MNFVKQYWKSVVMGLCGAAVFFIAWHLWIDHTSLHQIIGILNAQSAAAQKAAGK